MKWNRNVAIVGVGRTHATSKRNDVNQGELIHEAVTDALRHAGLTMKDIDCNLIGDMELFQGDYSSDLWQVDGFGGRLRPGYRMTTGGTTGAMLCCSATYLVASGQHDIVMAVGFQKHDEGNATSGLSSVEDPVWPGWFGAGVGGGFAVRFFEKYGKDIELTAAQLRVQAGDNAAANPYAHLRNKVTIEEVMNSPMLSFPSRLLHLCPQTSAASCIIFAAEDRARKITDKPVWVKDFVTVHREQCGPDARFGEMFGPHSCFAACAERLYNRNNIKNPIEELDIYEMYNASVWFTFGLMEDTLRIPEGKFRDMIASGDTARDGRFPISPSGGVLTSNPIGASAMLRVAEAALQIRGECGDYQVSKPVKNAIASGFGGSGWYVMHLLSKDK